MGQIRAFKFLSSISFCSLEISYRVNSAIKLRRDLVWVLGKLDSLVCIIALFNKLDAHLRGSFSSVSWHYKERIK
jgi:hypothetical protein